MSKPAPPYHVNHVRAHLFGGERGNVEKGVRVRPVVLLLLERHFLCVEVVHGDCDRQPVIRLVLVVLQVVERVLGVVGAGWKSI